MVSMVGCDQLKRPTSARKNLALNARPIHSFSHGRLNWVGSVLLLLLGVNVME